MSHTSKSAPTYGSPTATRLSQRNLQSLDSFTRSQDTPKTLSGEMRRIKEEDRAAHLKKKFKTIWLVLADPAALAYLLCFSRRQHNSENVEYWCVIVTSYL